MTTIARPLSIVNLCQGWVWLQYADHYQSLLCVQSPDNYQYLYFL
jgi:hypothetical protein